MPVRSLSSRVLVWPNREEVDQAVRRWAARGGAVRPELMRAGYFGSYARGTWGVGSDLDLLLVVSSSREPFERRAASWDTLSLPVPVDVLVYTEEEWNRLLGRPGTLAACAVRDVVWVYPP